MANHSSILAWEESVLGNSMDRGNWRATVHGVAKSWTWLSDWTHTHYHIWYKLHIELWFWRRLSRVPWTARRSNQSILKEINPKYSLEGLMLKLKLQYFGHLMWKANSLEKTLMLGKIEGKRRRDDIGWDGWMALLTQWTWVWDAGDGQGQGSLECYSLWGCKELDTT